MSAAPDFVVSAVVIRDEQGRVLVVRKRGTTRYMLPGGKIESGETPAEAAVRELHEEVGAELDLDLLVLLGEWSAPAANEPDHVVHGHVVRASDGCRTERARGDRGSPVAASIRDAGP